MVKECMKCPHLIKNFDEMLSISPDAKDDELYCRKRNILAPKSFFEGKTNFLFLDIDNCPYSPSYTRIKMLRESQLSLIPQF